MRNTSEDERGTWAALVKSVREAGGLTKSELGRRLDVDRGTIHRWEIGQNRPDGPDVVHAFATLFGLDVDDALRRAGLLPTAAGNAPPAEPPLPMDPDVKVLLRKLADPDTNEQTKAYIRRTLQILADMPDDPPDQSRGRRIS